ncbi:MAG: 4-alpha-glucanotransferase [Bdellovibrionota bacterium]
MAWGGTLRKFHIQLNTQLETKTNPSDVQLKISDKVLDFKILNTLNRKNRKTLYIQVTTKIPIGYHDLLLFIKGQKTATSFIISAPEKLEVKTARAWGPFLPTYALRSNSNWGIGSYTDLMRAALICKKYGASFISILPSLAGRFEASDCDPSPYSALTRFFWNEIYLDVDSLLQKYPVKEALQMRESADFIKKLSVLRDSEYVDYYKCYQLKKQFLLLLAGDFFKKTLPDSYHLFLEKNPQALRYAEFRSKNNQEPNGNTEREINYHLFVQYETDLALMNISRNSGIDLYMDYPVGVNDSGFDYKDDDTNFLGSVSVGAPPEPVFQLGQDWGFPSFHPQKLPLKKYSYFIDSIRQHLKYSKILRLDHVIGLYRIYSVPKGYGGKNGAYIRFSEEDFFAIIVLEASNAGADIIGENLGTVPAKVNEILKKRNLKGMQILQLDLGERPENLISKIDQNTLCALNTHDMPMFESFMKAEDLDEVLSLGILHSDFYAQFKQERFEQLQKWENIFLKNPVIGALKYLASSKCHYLVVNLEDLWNEERPQNIPGTWKEVPNWRRKMAIPIEEWENHENCKLAFNSLKTTFS